MKFSQWINKRLLIALILLFVGAARQIAHERSIPVLRPGLHLYAYVANTRESSVTVVDLVALAARGQIVVGPSPSGIRAHPRRDEVWGVSTDAGMAWIIDVRRNAVVAQIPVGAAPFALEFSPDGRRAYVAASGAGTVSAIDCALRSIVARARIAGRPWLVRATPDGKMLLVSRRGNNSLALLDSATLAPLGDVPVSAEPESIAVLPDSTKAFIASGGANWVSAVDLRRKALLVNLQVSGRPRDLILSADGGELYVLTESNGLDVIDTWRNETGDHVVIGSSPAQGAFSAERGILYITDTAAGRVAPVYVAVRRVEHPISVGQRPLAARLTPEDNLLLVVNEGSNNLAVIRTRTNSLMTLIPVGLRPRDVAVKIF